MKKIIVPSDHDIFHMQPLDSIPSCQYIVESGAHLTVLTYTKSSQDIQGSIQIYLQGEHAAVDIIGVFVCTDKQNISLHTLQQHEARMTQSNLLVKAVLQSQSHFSYDGAIRVEPLGQKTDAYQRNENLLLADSAHADSKPSLEILADDVRCTHGATISSINSEQLFYLASRGIEERLGKKLITQGFLESALEKVRQSPHKDNLGQHLWQNL